MNKTVTTNLLLQAQPQYQNNTVCVHQWLLAANQIQLMGQRLWPIKGLCMRFVSIDDNDRVYVLTMLAFQPPDLWSSSWCLCSGADSKRTTPAHSPSAPESWQQPITSLQMPSTPTSWATPPAAWWRAAVQQLSSSAAHRLRRWLRRFEIYILT